MVGVGAGYAIRNNSNRRSDGEEVSTHEERIVHCGIFLLSITGVILLGFGLSSNNNTMIEVGFVLFMLTFIVWGLSCVFVILVVLLGGVMKIARGMSEGYVNVLSGLIIIILSLLELSALGDIAFNCALDMFPIIIFSWAFIGIITGGLVFIADTVKILCLKRWGTILMATVHERRRHYSENNNGGGTYTHELLVSYEVEISHQSHCWRRSFRYHGVSSSATSTDLRKESNGAVQSIDVGRPVQPGLEQDKTNDTSKRSIQTWLSVNENQYRPSPISIHNTIQGSNPWMNLFVGDNFV